MLKLMIVDDEAVIRNGLRTIVEWEKMGIELVAECSNGRDALDRALVLQPDIVLTDIKMPIIDGIDFVTQLLEKRPEVRVIFLTGYSDYEYMQKAVKLSVEDYLLKPIRILELESLIRRVSKDIIEERQKKEQRSSVIRLLAKNRPVLFGNCLNLFLVGKYSYQVFLEEASQLGIHLYGPQYTIMVIDIDDYSHISKREENNYQLRFAVLNIAEEILTQIGECSFGYLPLDSRMIGIVNMENIGLEDVMEACRQLQFYVQRFLKFTVTIALASEISELELLPEAYYEVCNALTRKIYLGKNQILTANTDSQNISQKTILLKKQDELDIREAFSMRNNLRVQKKLDEVFSIYLSEEQYSARSIRQFGFTLLTLVLHILEDENITQDEVYGMNAWPGEELAGYETVNEIHMFMKNIYFCALQALEKHNVGGNSKLVREAMKYVQQNYANTIRVTDVAAVVYVSPNYFSKVFKQETGEAFTEWLNRFRVEKAKEMIKDQLDEKVYEIAAKVGFTDYKYFSFIFKKYTGYTPVTYKNLMQ